MESWAAAVLSPSLRLVQGAFGFGVHASVPIEPGTLLVRVPPALAVTAEGALRVPSVASLVSRDTEAHVTLAVWLLYMRDSNSTHGTYSRALADADIDCTLLWSEAELAYLQASRALAKAHVLRQWAAGEWQQILSRASSSAWPLVRPATQSDFNWALCAIWSRSFQLACADEDCGGAAGTSGGVWRVLAPGADLLNHDGTDPAAQLQVRAAGARPEQWEVSTRGEVEETDEAAEDALVEDAAALAHAAVSASWSYAGGSDDESTDALILHARRHIAPDSEVTLDYGARANADLLSTHGFALEENAGEHTPLSLTLSPADQLTPLKARLLAAGNVSAPYELSARALQTDSPLLVALRIGAANLAELAGDAYAPAFMGKPLSRRNERRWRSMLRERVGYMLREAEVESSADDDVALLQRLDDDVEMTQLGRRARLRRRAALLTRLGEKRMLRQVLSTLDNMRGEKDGEGGGAERDPVVASLARDW